MSEDLTKLKKADLVELADKAGIKDAVKFKKEELIDLLEAGARSATPEEVKEVEAKIEAGEEPMTEAEIEKVITKAEPVYTPKAIVHNGDTVYAIFTKRQFGDAVVDVTPLLQAGDPGKIIGPRYKALAQKMARRMNFEVRYE